MYIIDKQGRICQGDLYNNFLFLEYDEKEDNLDFSIIDYAFVLSQECDLKWDYEGHNFTKIKYNQFLNSVLCCPAYRSLDLREGTYFDQDETEIKMHYFGKEDSTSWKHVKQNSNPRYHFLRQFKVNEITIPELVLDFKHYYSVPRDLFYHYRKKAIYKARLNVPFRELVSQRFAYFISRIGEPDLINNVNEIDCDLDPCFTE